MATELADLLTSGGFSSAEAAAILQEHITAVIGHFKGKVSEWDVVNEAIADGAPYGMQPSYWLDKLGPNYVDMAFRWAHEADPGVRLFYNEMGAEALGTKSDVVHNLLQGMLSRGPVHGVGLQMHVEAARGPSADSISGNIKRSVGAGGAGHGDGCEDSGIAFASGTGG